MRKDEIMINVIFDAAKGDVPILSREAVSGHPFGTLPHPVRAGYSFAGWYLDGTLVSEDTPVTGEEDIRLVAHWIKKKGEKRKSSMYKKQKAAVAVLSFLMAFLLITLFVVNHIVAIYGLEDVYYGEDGTKHTEKYYVRKKQGAYGLYDKNGEKMAVNDDGYFIAHSGNQYSIDAETGEYELYAVVDYDAAAGEVLGYSGKRVMIYPEIELKDIYSIEVTNQYGDYTFSRNENGDMRLNEIRESMATYDQELYSRLCVSCRYTLTTQKLDFISRESNAPRLEDGSIDYSAYGLADLYDEEGNLTYTPAVFTITKAIYAEDGTCTPDAETSYTVKVGDALLSGDGYYVQLQGRDSVYIVDSDIGKTVLQPVEALISPSIIYQSGSAAYAMVQDFVLAEVDLAGSLADKDKLEDLDMDFIVAFTYEDLEMRENTLYNSTAYVPAENESGQRFMDGYDINQDSAGEVLGLFYEMEYIACKKLGITEEALEEYGLNDKVYYLNFASPMLDENNYVSGYMENILLISQKTENNTYYVASYLTDMIVEVDQYYLSFLEWEQKMWYHQYFFSTKIPFVTEMHFQIGDQKFDFILDNSETDQSEVAGTAKLKVFCEQYLGGTADPHQLDYTLTYTYITDTGAEKTEQITGVDNFRKLYVDLLAYSLEGDLNEKEFETNLGMSVKDYIAQGEDVCDAIISFRAEDLAATLNDYTYKDKDGNEIKLYTENNKTEVVMRFYRYSEGKALLTLEVIKGYNADGTPISDPEKAYGGFYVSYAYLDELLQDITLLLSNQPVEPKG